MTGNWPEVKRSFKETQQEFASYIRNPQTNPAPKDVKQDRMQMYRELFFNNVEGFIASNFPILRSIMPDSKWFALVQAFFASHSCKTPHFSEIPEEFLNYLQNEYKAEVDMPFVLELAHYEWVEMALAIAKAELPVNVAMQSDILFSALNLSPLAWCLVYQFPVHQISSEYIPAKVPDNPTFLVVYRNNNDDVKFLEVTPMIYRMLEIIEERPAIEVQMILEQLVDEFEVVDTAEFRRFGQKAITELNEKTIVLPA